MRHKDCVFLLVSHYYIWFFAKIPQHSLANPILPATQERMLLLCLHPQCIWASVTANRRDCCEFPSREPLAKGREGVAQGLTWLRGQTTETVWDKEYNKDEFYVYMFLSSGKKWQLFSGYVIW